MTPHQWLGNVRCFFTDVCSWATEPGSPFAEFAPAAVPFERHELRNVGMDKARRRQASRLAATVIDLEREMPKLRALALRRWHEPEQTLGAAPEAQASVIAEAEAFWDWALSNCSCRAGCGSRKRAS